MRKNQSSLTATGIALVRAVESQRPADERICYDPYARQFVPAWMYTLLGFLIKSGYAELRGPGVNAFLLARERYFDDFLQNSVAEGMQQLVILGAGYDSRAYRFDLPDRVKVFEVDHPATQADKLEKVKRIFGKIPQHVTYVPIDFNNQKLAESLLSSGFDPALESLFIWQGVTMYLTPEGVDATLAFVSQNTAAGSAIIFDFVHQSVLDGIQKQSEIRSMRRYRFFTGETLNFGIAQDSVRSFLLERGFHQAIDVSTNELKAAYFTGKKAGRKISGGYGLAIGKV